MKHLLYLTCAGLFLASGLALAQSVTPKDKQGDKALVFSLNGFGNFGLSGIGIGAVGHPAGGYHPVMGAGGRFYLADRTALRAGVGFGSTSTTGDSAVVDTSGTVIGISPGIEFHLMNAGPVSPYVGALIEFATESVTYKGGSGSSAFEENESSSSFGVAAVLGAEWFPWSNVSFGGEYAIGFRTMSGTWKYTQGTSTSEQDMPGRTEIGIGAYSLSVFASIYI